MRVLCIFALSMLLVCPSVMAAKVYKWVDENGKVHYSDTPRASASKVVMESSKPASDSLANTTAKSATVEKAHQVLCQKATRNMKRFIPDIEEMAKQAMEMDPSASKADFQEAMSALQELKRVPASALTNSCVNDYDTDDQARSFATCFGEANSAMEASVCMAFSAG
ncbi:MAG: DUF4124 domain-containing protein [Pseudomonadota bacterium]